MRQCDEKDEETPGMQHRSMDAQDHAGPRQGVRMDCRRHTDWKRVRP